MLFLMHEALRTRGAAWFSGLRLGIRRRGDQARLCNFERFSSFPLQWYITSRSEKVTKFGKDNYEMHRMCRKKGVRTCSLLIRGGRKPTTVVVWRLVEPHISRRIPRLDHRGSNDQANHPLFVKSKEILSHKISPVRKDAKNRPDPVLIRTKLFASSRH